MGPHRGVAQQARLVLVDGIRRGVGAASEGELEWERRQGNSRSEIREMVELGHVVAEPNAYTAL
jgi:hypothetical protein